MCNIVKVSVGTTPQCVLMFVSVALDGRVSDKCFTEHSGILDKLLPEENFLSRLRMHNLRLSRNDTSKAKNACMCQGKRPTSSNGCTRNWLIALSIHKLHLYSMRELCY